MNGYLILFADSQDSGGPALRDQHRGDLDLGRAPAERHDPGSHRSQPRGRLFARHRFQGAPRWCVGLGLAALTAAYAYQASLRSPAVRLDAGFGLTELAVFLRVVRRDRRPPAGAPGRPNRAASGELSRASPMRASSFTWGSSRMSRCSSRAPRSPTVSSARSVRSSFTSVLPWRSRCSCSAV